MKVYLKVRRLALRKRDESASRYRTKTFIYIYILQRLNMALSGVEDGLDK